MSVNKTIAQRIAELRKDKGVTQDEIAKFLEVKRATVANYETGQRSPDYETIIKLADYYGVSCDYILRGIKSEYSEINSTTGLLDEAIESLQSQKNNVFYTTRLTFLINNKALLNTLGNYLFSSVCSEFANSEYIHLPLRNESLAFYIRNPEMAQKAAYSALLDVLPFVKAEMTAEIQNNKALKESLLSELAKSAAEIKCEDKESDAYGVYPETKEQAEIILAELGISMPDAIGMFVKQVVIQNGMPFEIRLVKEDQEES